jgi:hypothetical protein
MSPSHWLPYIAAIGIVLAGAVHGQPVGDDPGSQTRSDKAQDKPKTDQLPSVLEAIQHEIERFTRALEANVDKPKPPEEEDRAKRDLAAQEGMAYWAKWMFWAALASIILTTAGIFLIWRTLIYTRRAAIAAAEAVVEAKDATKAAILGAKAAQDAVAVASDTAERQLRAYITIESGGIVLRSSENGFVISATARLKNTGQTPGYDLRTSATVTVERRNTDKPFSAPHNKGETGDSSSIVGASQDANVDRSKAISTAELEEIRRGQKAIFFWGRADYRDAFKMPRYLIFKTWMWGPEMSFNVGGVNFMGWALNPHPSGYESD